MTDTPQSRAQGCLVVLQRILSEAGTLGIQSTLPNGLAMLAVSDGAFVCRVNLCRGDNRIEDDFKVSFASDTPIPTLFGIYAKSGSDVAKIANEASRRLS